jgi:hypothetical protein
MERDKRIELSPPPWQGGVLPLYESRKTSPQRPKTLIAWRTRRDKADRNVTSERAKLEIHPGEDARSGLEKPASGLVNFHDASRFHNGRLLLTFGEPLGALTVNVDAGEFLAVVVVHSDLPVAMFAPSVLVESAGTLCFCLCLLHYGMALDARDYRKFDSAAQVARRGLTVLLFSNYGQLLASRESGIPADEQLGNIFRFGGTFGCWAA